MRGWVRGVALGSAVDSKATEFADNSRYVGHQQSSHSIVYHYRYFKWYISLDTASSLSWRSSFLRSH